MFVCLFIYNVAGPGKLITTSTDSKHPFSKEDIALMYHILVLHLLI
jgi:hypothetical protein